MNKDIEYKLRKKYLVRRPIVFTLLGSFSLLTLYFLILIFANSLQHAIQEFLRMWYWVLLLVIGFGLQIGLFIYLKGFIKLRKIMGVSGSIAATGRISAGSMLACCAHHISDVIPIIGISAATIFFNKYQILFIIIGVLSNIIGITYMLKIIQKHNLYTKKENIYKLMSINLNKLFFLAISLSINYVSELFSTYKLYLLYLKVHQL